jgi:formylglycine-generating enzyme required for sulfatase activity
MNLAYRNSKPSLITICILFLSILQINAQSLGDTYTDDFGIEMVFVPSGTFELGISTKRMQSICEGLGTENLQQCVEGMFKETGLSNVESKVTVLQFWIDRYEVTIESFRDFCTSPRIALLTDCQELHAEFSQDARQPQINVSWYVASAYCNERGARLPTEIEWEYAASGTEKLVFPWGDDYEPSYIHVAGFDTTYPVGSIEENRSWVGAYDMAGNVSEWVENYFYMYGDYVVTPPPATTGPESARNLGEIFRVVRGGSWNSHESALTNLWRESHGPYSADTQIGFRCARTHIPA